MPDCTLCDAPGEGATYCRAVIVIRVANALNPFLPPATESTMLPLLSHGPGGLERFRPIIRERKHGATLPMGFEA
jgi:hypothetical protein